MVHLVFMSYTHITSAVTGPKTGPAAQPVRTCLYVPFAQPCVSKPLPLPSRLRAKVAKRCQRCEMFLIKPESKAQSTKFTIKESAISHIPIVSIAHPLPHLVAGSTVPLLVRIRNPLEEDLSITVSAIMEHTTADIRIACSQLTIPSFDPLASLEEAIPEPGRIEGILEVRANSVLIKVQVSPREMLESELKVRSSTKLYLKL